MSRIVAAVVLMLSCVGEVSEADASVTGSLATGGGSAATGGGSVATGGGGVVATGGGGGSVATGGGGGSVATGGGGSVATGGGGSVATGGGGSVPTGGGGSVATGGGSIATGGGSVATGGGSVATGGGSVATGGGSSDAGTSFTFLVYGDSRDGNHTCTSNDIHAQLVARMAAEPADMVFHTGDMVTGYDNSTTWVRNNFNCGPSHAPGTFKALIAPLQSKAPVGGLPTFFFPVIGNHDDAWGDCSNGVCWYPDQAGDGVCSVFPKELVSKLVPNHRRASYFQDPTNHTNMPPFASDDDFYAKMCSTAASAAGVAYPTYFYYSFDHHNTHFVVLRVNTDITDLEECGSCESQSNYDNYYNIHQLHWLRYDLAKARATPGIENIVMFLHAPIFTTSDGHGPVASATVLATEASKYGVKLVFSGHDHVYERTVPIRVDAAHLGGTPDDAGTTYVVTGGGGSAPHGFHAKDWFDAFRTDDAHRYHYVRVTVTNTQMQATVIDQDGAVVEHFTR